MNTICLYLFVVVLSLSQCEYTMTYLYPLRLGDKATEVKMIVDSKEDQSSLVLGRWKPERSDPQKDTNGSIC